MNAQDTDLCTAYFMILPGFLLKRKTSYFGVVLSDNAMTGYELCKDGLAVFEIPLPDRTWRGGDIVCIEWQGQTIVRILDMNEDGTYVLRAGKTGFEDIFFSEQPVVKGVLASVFHNRKY